MVDRGQGHDELDGAQNGEHGCAQRKHGEQDRKREVNRKQLHPSEGKGEGGKVGGETRRDSLPHDFVVMFLPNTRRRLYV